jgi:hypothetical protein
MPALLINFNERERAMIDEMMASAEQPCETMAEWLRLLIHREYNRRKGLPKPEPKDYQTAFRNYRPVTKVKAVIVPKRKIEFDKNTIRCDDSLPIGAYRILPSQEG